MAGLTRDLLNELDSLRTPVATNQTARNASTDGRKAALKKPSGSVIGDALSGFGAGVAEGAGMVSGAAEWIAPEGSGAERVARGLKTAARDFVEDSPSLHESEASIAARQKSWLNPRGWIYDGTKTVGMLAAPIAAAAGAKVAGLGAAAAGIGAAVTGAQFWGSTAQDAYDEISKERPDTTEEERLAYANIKGFFEGGVEALQTALPLSRLGKLLPASVKGQLAKQASGLVGTPLKTFAKDMAKMYAGEIGMELFQEAAGATTDYAYEMREDLPSLEEIRGVVGPTIIATTILGTGAHASNARDTKRIAKALEDVNAPVEERMAAVRAVESRIKREDEELASMWLEQALPLAAEGRVIAILDDAVIRAGGRPAAPAETAQEPAADEQGVAQEPPAPPTDTTPTPEPEQAPQPAQPSPPPVPSSTEQAQPAPAQPAQPPTAPATPAQERPKPNRSAQKPDTEEWLAETFVDFDEAALVDYETRLVDQVADTQGRFTPERKQQLALWITRAQRERTRRATPKPGLQPRQETQPQPQPQAQPQTQPQPTQQAPAVPPPAPQATPQAVPQQQPAPTQQQPAAPAPVVETPAPAPAAAPATQPAKKPAGKTPAEIRMEIDQETATINRLTSRIDALPRNDQANRGKLMSDRKKAEKRRQRLNQELLATNATGQANAPQTPQAPAAPAAAPAQIPPAEQAAAPAPAPAPATTESGVVPPAPAGEVALDTTNITPEMGKLKTFKAVDEEIRKANAARESAQFKKQMGGSQLTRAQQVLLDKEVAQLEKKISGLHNRKQQIKQERDAKRPQETAQPADQAAAPQTQAEPVVERTPEEQEKERTDRLRSGVEAMIADNTRAIEQLRGSLATGVADPTMVLKLAEMEKNVTRLNEQLDKLSKAQEQKDKQLAQLLGTATDTATDTDTAAPEPAAPATKQQRKKRESKRNLPADVQALADQQELKRLEEAYKVLTYGMSQEKGEALVDLANQRRQLGEQISVLKAQMQGAQPLVAREQTPPPAETPAPEPEKPGRRRRVAGPRKKPEVDASVARAQQIEEWYQTHFVEGDAGNVLGQSSQDLFDQVFDEVSTQVRTGLSTEDAVRAATKPLTVGERKLLAPYLQAMLNDAAPGDAQTLERKRGMKGWAKRERKKDLVVYHKVFANHLATILDLYNGSLPMPSVAVSRLGFRLTSAFGDVILVAKKSLLGGNRITTPLFERDVWSPRTPTRVFADINRRILDKRLKDIEGQLTDPDTPGIDPDLLMPTMEHPHRIGVLHEFAEDRTRAVEQGRPGVMPTLRDKIKHFNDRVSVIAQGVAQGDYSNAHGHHLSRRLLAGYTIESAITRYLYLLDGGKVDLVYDDLTVGRWADTVLFKGILSDPYVRGDMGERIPYRPPEIVQQMSEKPIQGGELNTSLDLVEEAARRAGPTLAITAQEVETQSKLIRVALEKIPDTDTPAAMNEMSRRYDDAFASLYGVWNEIYHGTVHLYREEGDSLALGQRKAAHLSYIRYREMLEQNGEVTTVDVLENIGNIMDRIDGRDLFNELPVKERYTLASSMKQAWAKMDKIQSRYMEAKPARAVHISEFGGALIPAATDQEYPGLKKALRDAGIEEVHVFDDNPAAAEVGKAWQALDNVDPNALDAMMAEIWAAEEGDAEIEIDDDLGVSFYDRLQSREIRKAIAEKMPHLLMRTREITKTGGYTLDEVADMAEAIMGEFTNSPPTYVVQSVDDLPFKLRADLYSRSSEDTATGVFDVATGEVYLIADNIGTPQEVAETIIHEVGAHYSLRDMLSKERLNALLDSVWSKHQKNIRAFVSEHYGDLNLDTPQGRRIAAEEYLASVIETNPDTDVLSTVVDAILEFVQKILKAAGINELTFTEADLRNIARASIANLKKAPGETPTPDGTGTDGRTPDSRRSNRNPMRETPSFEANDRRARGKLHMRHANFETREQYETMFADPDVLDYAATFVAKRDEALTEMGYDVHTVASPGMHGAIDIATVISRGGRDLMAVHRMLHKKITTASHSAISAHLRTLDAGDTAAARPHNDQPVELYVSQVESIDPEGKPTGVLNPLYSTEARIARELGLKAEGVFINPITYAKFEQHYEVKGGEGVGSMLGTRPLPNALTQQEREAGHGARYLQAIFGKAGTVGYKELAALDLFDGQPEKLHDTHRRHSQRSARRLFGRIAETEQAGVGRVDVPQPVGRPEHDGASGERAGQEVMARRRSRPPMSQDWIDAYEETITTPKQEMSLLERVEAAFERIKNIDTERLRAGILDVFAPIERMERDANAGQLLDADSSPSKAARLSQNVESTVAAIMQKGAIAYRNGGFALANVQSGKGLVEIFNPLTTHPDGDLTLVWEGWAAARRAERLMAEGKENNFTQVEIDALKNVPAQYLPTFNQVLNDYQDFNDAMLDMLVSVGAINQAAKDQWSRHRDYVPFYRETEDLLGDQSTRPPGHSPNGIRPGDASKRLKGGMNRVGSILENIVMNVSHMTDTAFKTVAMQRTMDMAVQSGAAVDVTGNPNIGRRNDVFSVKYGGVARKFLIVDRNLALSVGGMSRADLGRVWKPFVFAKHLLTSGATLDPAFMVANFFRDAFSTWVATDTDMTPLLDSMKGAARALKKDDVLFKIMAAGGGLGGYYDASPESVRKHLHADMVRAATSQSFKDSVLDTPFKLMRAWTRVGSASEAAHRIVKFDDVVRKGGSEAEAAYQAMDILNFSRRGGFKAMQILIESVPFLNARVQGLDRMMRGFADNPTSFATKGAILVAATLVLRAMNDDEERYQDLQEWDKDLYWHFFVGDEHFRLPKPFEVGLIFGTIPERVFGLGNEEGGSLLFKSAMHNISETLGVNPIPQLAKPIIEQIANKTFFSGSPILTQHMMSLEPEMQADPWTSETMVALADAMPDAAPDWMRSPKRLETALRGYTAAIGSYVIGVSDMAVRAMSGDLPQEPDTEPSAYPVAKRFYRTGVPGQTKHYETFYELMGEADRAYRTIQTMKSRGMSSEEYKEENRQILKARTYLASKQKQVRTIGAEIRKTYDRADMSGEEKRERLNQLKEKRNVLIKEAVLKVKGNLADTE
jgi:hypothetical protein